MERVAENDIRAPFTCFHKCLFGHICAQRRDTEGTPAFWRRLRTWTGPLQFHNLNPFILPSCWKYFAWSHSNLGATSGLFSGACWAPVSYNHSSPVSSSSFCPWRSTCFSTLHLHHNLKIDHVQHQTPCSLCQNMLQCPRWASLLMCSLKEARDWLHRA